jgi:hypothetical protein
VGSDSGTTLESHIEEGRSCNSNKGITLISSKKLVKSPYLLSMDHPNAPPELGYISFNTYYKLN